METDDIDKPLLAGIEAGGTKFNCAVAKNPNEILKEERFATTDPDTLLPQVVKFFKEASDELGPIQTMGIGTFGPADINPKSPGYGSILTTPKKNWAGANIVNEIRKGLGVPLPIAFETDVNAAALGEALYGAGENMRTIAYVTVGTGIGGSLFHDGQFINGRMHSEIGHMVMPDFDKNFGTSTNVCPFHDSCLEGRASGPAMEARWGMPGLELEREHKAWDLEAAYLAAGCINLTAAWSPEIIIMGGGVFQNELLVDKVRCEFDKQAGQYWSLPVLGNYIKVAGLGQKAGIVGALALAQRLL